jgi:hypothetical protein
MKQFIHKAVLVFFILILVVMAKGQRYVFYLHGKIIEDQGIHAVDELHGYGAYEYENILRAFRSENFIVMSEARPKNTDPEKYALRIAAQVDSLLKKCVAPRNITIIGASKGSEIAMLASSELKNKQLNFVFMAACNDDLLQQFPNLRVYGNILSIYELSDDIGKSCASLQKQSSSSISHYKEIRLNTGLKHGFLYKPRPAWVEPAVKWANARYD